MCSSMYVSGNVQLNAWILQSLVVSVIHLHERPHTHGGHNMQQKYDPRHRQIATGRTINNHIPSCLLLSTCATPYYTFIMHNGIQHRRLLLAIQSWITFDVDLSIHANRFWRLWCFVCTTGLREKNRELFKRQWMKLLPLPFNKSNFWWFVTDGFAFFLVHSFNTHILKFRVSKILLTACFIIAIKSYLYGIGC